MTTRIAFSIRVSEELHKWLIARALANDRSVNSEIIQLLKAAKIADERSE